MADDESILTECRRLSDQLTALHAAIITRSRERARLIMTLHRRGMPMREIGRNLSISEARISQIITREKSK